MTASIMDLRIVEGGNQPGSDYVRIPVDLNRGAGGRHIYLCYRRGLTTRPPRP